MTESIGIKWSEHGLPWKNLALELSQVGCVLHNWPEIVRAPGQNSKDSNKGIAELGAHEQQAMVDAFNDAHYPLHFEVFEDAKTKQCKS